VSAVSNQTYDYTEKTTNNSELSLLNDSATLACGPLINHLTYNNVPQVHTPENK
jgi:hypothetical protein